MTGKLGYHWILKSYEGTVYVKVLTVYSYTHSEADCSTGFDTVISRIQKNMSIIIV